MSYYGSGRKYRKNDWWDFMTVIEQELEKNNSTEIYVDILDELKWRLTDSISEGATYKIRVKSEELKKRFLNSNLTSSKELDDLFKELT
jgi:hypothetical protein